MTTGAKTTIGKPAIFGSMAPSPSGQYLLVTEIKKPFSHTVPINGFPQDVEILTRSGEVAKKIADLPSREGTSLTGVETGPRCYQWRADQPATVLWVEALDGGDLKNKVPFRDKRRRRSRRRSPVSPWRSRKPNGATAASPTPTPASRC